jgi:hypothetical protein
MGAFPLELPKSAKNIQFLPTVVSGFLIGNPGLSRPARATSFFWFHEV